MTRLWIALGAVGTALAVAAVLILQAALATATAYAQSRGETARVVWPFETSSLDPAGAGVQRSTWGVSWHIYDRLVSYALDQPRGKAG